MDPLQQLNAALLSRDLALLEAAERDLQASHPGQSFTWYAKAELARRRGDPRAAIAPSATGLAAHLGMPLLTAQGELRLRELLQALLGLPPARLEEAMAHLEQFGDLLERTGITRRFEGSLEAIVAPWLEHARRAGLSTAHVQAAAYLLGFTPHAAADWVQRVFEVFVVPAIAAAGEGGQLDTALSFETLAYSAHVKRRESQEWFRATTGRWIPALAAHARRAGFDSARAHSRWRPEAKRRVAFFVHKASMLAHVVVLLETLAAIREVGPRDYEFTVFVMGARKDEVHRAFANAGVALRYLAEEAHAQYDRLVALQRILREENFGACIWVSAVALMAVAFPMRIAPLQGWWAMKYHACEVPEIDFRMAVENVVTRKVLEGVEWRTIGNASTRWFDPALLPAARELRATFPADAIVAACIAREEKLTAPDFLEAIVELLRRHPRMIFVWTGRHRHEAVQGAFERAGVAARTRFAGWVNTKLYAAAVDIFLDSFPFPCGFSLKEAMAAGKPVVMYRSPESLETGVPGAISSIIERPESAPAEARARLERIFTREAPFDLYCCADSPSRYVEIVDRLVADPGFAAAAGAANRGFIEEFASSPREEARKFLDHLDELFEAIPRAAA